MGGGLLESLEFDETLECDLLILLNMFVAVVGDGWRMTHYSHITDSKSGIQHQNQGKLKAYIILLTSAYRSKGDVLWVETGFC